MFRRKPLLQQLNRDRVAVHTRDGKSLAGFVVGTYPDALVLEHARLLDSPAVVALDGQVVIPLANISFLQTGFAVDDTRALP